MLRGDKGALAQCIQILEMKRIADWLAGVVLIRSSFRPGITTEILQPRRNWLPLHEGRFFHASEALIGMHCASQRQDDLQPAQRIRSQTRCVRPELVGGLGTATSNDVNATLNVWAKQLVTGALWG